MAAFYLEQEQKRREILNKVTSEANCFELFSYNRHYPGDSTLVDSFSSLQDAYNRMLEEEKDDNKHFPNNISYKILACKDTDDDQQLVHTFYSDSLYEYFSL